MFLHQWILCILLCMTLENKHEILTYIFNFRSDLAYFDGLSETILCAGLAKPKPGIVILYFNF